MAGYWAGHRLGLLVSFGCAVEVGPVLIDGYFQTF